MLYIEGPVSQLQTAKFGIMENLIVRIKHQDIPVSELHQNFFLNQAVSTNLSKAFDKAHIECVWEPLVGSAAGSVDASNAIAKRVRIRFVAPNDAQLNTAIGWPIVFIV